MTKDNRQIEEIDVLTPTMTEEYAHCISVDECIERLNQRVHQQYHPEEWTKEEYFAMLDRAEQGPSYSFASVEELDRYIRSL